MNVYRVKSIQKGATEDTVFPYMVCMNAVYVRVFHVGNVDAFVFVFFNINNSQCYKQTDYTNKWL